MDTIWQDLRLTLRLVRQSPGFAATIVLTLALGIGATAAIFGVVNGLLLRSLPVADPQRLVSISSDAWLARGHNAAPWTFAMWESFQPYANRFEGILAWTPARFDLAPSGERQLAEGVFASGGYFATLGVPAILGRMFTADDDRPGGGADGPVAVIGYDFWRRRFGGAADVIGRMLVVDGTRVAIVGVTPPEFFGVDVGRAFDVAVPLGTEPLIRGDRSTLHRLRLLVMLRLKPDQSIEAGTATLRSLQPAILGVTAESMSVPPRQNWDPFTLVSAATGMSLPVRGPSGLRQSYARPLVTVLVVVGVVLVIACVNIASLLLARGTARRHELSVRLALGAPRSRLVRQLLIESLVFAALGAVAGFLIAGWGSQALVAQLATPTDRITLNLSFDWRTLVFTAGVASATVGIFGTVPAFAASRAASLDGLKLQGRDASRYAPGARLASLSSGLVVLQVALSLTLVVAAALLVRSFERLSRVPLGFDPDRVLIVNVDTQSVRTNPADRVALFKRIVDAARDVPGVAHAGASIWTPVDGGMRLGDSASGAQFNFVTPGWFAAYGTTIRLGRDFSERDTAEGSPVAVVNEAFVRAVMPGRFPLGETIPYLRSGDGKVQRTIVGVVDDAIFDSQREGIHPIVYLPITQAIGDRADGPAAISIGIRPATGSPMQLARSVAAAVMGVDPDIRFTFSMLTDHVDASVRQERLVARLSGTFGGLALLIAALGLYGVTAYWVNRRVTEIGIRMALGAQRAHVLGLILRHTMALTAIGIGLGLAGASVVARSLRAMLFGLTPLDSGTFLGVGALFAVVAIIAASIPAHRATKVDPLAALRAH